mmetsp:Transcript_5821/g.12753  ORF Transcript_5821/g.12753 Transcript_5821/m.12753 type:complete len:259 (+) Transcript_5821:1294-2070(+)
MRHIAQQTLASCALRNSQFSAACKAATQNSSFQYLRDAKLVSTMDISCESAPDNLGSNTSTNWAYRSPPEAPIAPAAHADVLRALTAKRSEFLRMCCNAKSKSGTDIIPTTGSMVCSFAMDHSTVGSSKGLKESKCVAATPTAVPTNCTFRTCSVAMAHEMLQTAWHCVAGLPFAEAFCKAATLAFTRSPTVCDSRTLCLSVASKETSFAMRCSAVERLTRFMCGSTSSARRRTSKTLPDFAVWMSIWLIQGHVTLRV